MEENAARVKSRTVFKVVATCHALTYSLILSTIFINIPAVPTIFLIVYIAFVNLLAFIRTTCVDPGFLRKMKDGEYNINTIFLEDKVEIKYNLINITREIIFKSSQPTDTEHEKSLDSTPNTVFIQKFCATCNIFRPDKAAHCDSCGFCVLEKDHHCYWLGNCIARNNIKYYYIYLFSLVALMFFAYTRSSIVLRFLFRKYCAIPVFMIGSLYLCLLLCLGLFTLYYVFLACFDLSSREFLNRKSFDWSRFNLKNIFTRIFIFRPNVSYTKFEI